MFLGLKTKGKTDRKEGKGIVSHSPQTISSRPPLPFARCNASQVVSSATDGVVTANDFEALPPMPDGPYSIQRGDGAVIDGTPSIFTRGQSWGRVLPGRAPI